jgi:hypothetical protein
MFVTVTYFTKFILKLKISTITKKVNYRPTSDMKSEYEQIKFVKANLESKGLM